MESMMSYTQAESIVQSLNSIDWAFWSLTFLAAAHTLIYAIDVWQKEQSKCKS